MRKLKVAVIALLGLAAIIIAVPIGIVAARGEAFGELFQMKFESTGQKVFIAEAMRPYSLPRDSAIAPMRAGELRHSLRAEKDRNGGTFAFRPDVPAVTPRWTETPYDTALFGHAPNGGWDGPDHRKILEIAAGRTTPAQRAYLNAIAADPVWPIIDQIGAAPSVDVLGGQFVIPFADTAMWYDMPIPKFAVMKSFAYAGATRAAAHLAAQRPDSAEHALRSVIAFGFSMSDNAPSLIEQLIGVTIVNIGGDELERLYALRKDPRAAQLQATVDSLTKLVETGPKPLPLRVMNFENAVVVALSPCTNVKELLFGRSAENQALLDSFRAAAARFPSEHAYLDMIEQSAAEGNIGRFGYNDSPGLLLRAVHGVSSVAAAITGNQRLASCATMVLASW